MAVSFFPGPDGSIYVNPFSATAMVHEIVPSEDMTQVQVRFVDSIASGALATPSAGTIRVRGSLDGDVFHMPSFGGDIDATMTGANATYDVPEFRGGVQFIRLEFDGIAFTPAVSGNPQRAIVRIWRG